MVNVFDSANQLAKDLTQTPEYTDLQAAIKDVMDDKESNELFKKMDQIQTQIITAQQAGQPLSEDLQKEYSELNEKVQKNQNIVKLLTAEQALYKLIDDIQKTFTNPINDLYADLRK